MKKKLLVSASLLLLFLGAQTANSRSAALTFDASKGVPGTLTTPLGKSVSYTAYTGIYYVTNVEDSVYQYLNVYVPEGAGQSTPIFMPNGVAGYMASRPMGVNPGSASGRALAEGYVVVVAGARGRNSTVTKGSETIYTGRAPKGLLDLKAAIRYLRLVDADMPGDAEKIITDGTSAGGAMSALLGATGNNPAYDSYLKAMGAADTRDDIFAAVCFCPITDLDNADKAYEWTYGRANGKSRRLNDDRITVSDELAAQFGDYINSLGLTMEDGTPITAENYSDYMAKFLIESAQDAKDAGATIPDSIGFTFGNGMAVAAPMGRAIGEGGPPNAMRQGGPQGTPPDLQGMSEGMPQGTPPDMQVNQGKHLGDSTDLPNRIGQNISMNPQGGPRNRGGGPGGMPGGSQQGEYVISVDVDKYINYVASATAIKTPPAFDRLGIAGGSATAENEEFGDEKGSSVNFTPYSLGKTTGDSSLSEEMAENVRLLNPMRMTEDGKSSVAPHWYIRHGSKDADTSFPVPINLATRMMNLGKDVNFKLAWNRPHSGDYALNELFRWIKSICPAE